MEHIVSQWQPRIDRAEAQLAATFRFQNEKPAIALQNGKYEADARDRAGLARRVFDEIKKHV